MPGKRPTRPPANKGRPRNEWRNRRGGVSRETVLIREMECWRRKLRGDKQVAIAADLKITEGAVRQILERVRKRLAAEFSEEIHEMRIEHMGALEVAIEQAQEHFERSSDPAFLRLKLDALEQQRDIWAVNAPKKTESKISGEVALPGAFLTREQMKAEIDQRFAAHKRRS